MRTALILAVLLAAACGGHSFVPYGAEHADPLPRVTLRAVHAYPDDLKRLAEAGGALLGLIKTSQHMSAAVFVAERGGTHAIRILAHERYPSPTQQGPDKVSFDSPGYMVVRVEPEAWEKLSRPLRPRPIPEGAEKCDCKLDRSGTVSWRLSCEGAKPELDRAKVEKLCSDQD
jgi:hypothetical protein